MGEGLVGGGVFLRLLGRKEEGRRDFGAGVGFVIDLVDGFAWERAVAALRDKEEDGALIGAEVLGALAFGGQGFPSISAIVFWNFSSAFLRISDISLHSSLAHSG